MKLYTPDTLYQDYLANSYELDTSILREYSDESCKYYDVYFNGEKTAGGTPRVFATFSHPINDTFDLPLVVFCHEHGKSHKNKDAIKFFNDLGYAALACDYSGSGAGGKSTIYPDSLAYAKGDGRKWYFENEIGKTIDNAKDTPYYVWTVSTMQAVKLAISHFSSIVNANKIAIVGWGTGSYQAFHMAAVDKRIITAITIDGSGWSEYGNVNKFEESDKPLSFNNTKLSAGISRQSYAQFVNVPFLIMGGTMSGVSDMDRVFDTAYRINQRTISRVSLTPHSKNTVGYKQAETIKKWLEQSFYGGTFEEDPELFLKSENGALTVELGTGSLERIESISCFYGFDTYDARERHYECVPMKIEEKRITAKIVPPNSAKKIFAFANVTYKSGLTFSSNLVVRNLSDFAITEKKILSPLVIDKNCFHNLSTITRRNRKEFAIEREKTIVCKAIDDIECVSSKRNFIATLKIGTINKQRNSALALTVFVSQPIPLYCRVTEFKDDKMYEYEAHLKTKNNIWEKVIIQPIEFLEITSHQKDDHAHINRGKHLVSFEHVKNIEFYFKEADNIPECSFAIASLIVL